MAEQPSDSDLWKRNSQLIESHEAGLFITALGTGCGGVLLHQTCMPYADTSCYLCYKRICINDKRQDYYNYFLE